MSIKSIVKVKFILFFLIINNSFFVFTLNNKILNKKIDLTDQFISENLSGKKNLISIAIIGGGSAGLTAGIYGARAGLDTVVFTGHQPGGQLTETSYVENYPGIKSTLGSDIMDTLSEQANDFGVSIIETSINKVNFSKWPFILETEEGQKVHALSVIIATGSTPRKLEVPGEFEYWGKGISSCAICDCYFFKNEDVVIVGGGDAAIEEAMQLAPHVKNVTILVRSDKMRAAKRMQQKIKEFDNVKIIYNKQVIRALGNKQILTDLEIKDSISNKTELFKTDGLFLAIGQNPNTSLFSDFLELNRFGYIVPLERSQATSINGIFAAGDVEDNEYRQAVVAASSGCKSALEAVKWLRNIGLTDKVTKQLKK